MHTSPYKYTYTSYFYAHFREIELVDLKIDKITIDIRVLSRNMSSTTKRIVALNRKINLTKM